MATTINQLDAQSTSSLSATNFDLPSLYLLRPEVDVALHDAETHLSEFNDDEAQAPLLLDSIEVLKQLAAVLDLISLHGGSDLAEIIAASMQALYDAGDNMDDGLILDLSEAIMTLQRYIEFVLLKETLQPALLLPIINKLNATLDRDALTTDAFLQKEHLSISISNPEQNYQSLTSLGLDTPLLAAAYRAGLQVALSQDADNLTDEDKNKLAAMQAACALVAESSDTLFWRAAQAVTQDIEAILPLSTAQKRTLIFLEQQFHNYLPANDNRFADLVSFACGRSNTLSEKIKQKFAANSLSDEQLAQMRRYLFGPDREVTSTLNQLIQDEISAIKDKVDALARGEAQSTVAPSVEEISDKLVNLSSVMHLLQLNEAATALTATAEDVKKWQTPTPADFDKLLSALIVAENAAIHLAKTHTPGAMNYPLHNGLISVYQLDTAYETLVIESRTVLSTVEQAINDYIADDNHDMLNLSNTPEMIKQVAGAVSFLGLTDASNMLSRLARYIDEVILASTSPVSEALLAKIADVLMAVDYELEGLENNHPVGSQAMHIGNHSLNELLAVAA